MDIVKSIRLLAKSDKYQTLYFLFKEGNISLFENKSNYTDNQIIFLNYLGFYSSLYTDIYLKEVNEIVLEDFIYEDAYMHYKRKNKDKEEKATERNDQKDNINTNTNNSSTTNTTWVFKKPKKR